MSDQPKEFRWLHVTSTLVYLVYAGLLVSDYVTLLNNAGGNTALIATLAITPLIGYVLADFASGFVHFLGDTFGNEKTPIVGKAFIYAFREHHIDEKAITRHDFFYTNGNNCLVSLPVMLFLHHVLFGLTITYPWLGVIYSALLFLVISIFFTNQIHKWAHQDKPNAIAKWLQRQGIILTPERHKLHHTAPFTSDYCITTGWLNPMLRKTGFFPFAKAVLRRVPIMPKIDE